ncbi:MAG TPA: LysM peptidoglycan-binding domain-containing protein [Flavobacteriales bacterium]|nr:LysM peptidoglycan-binding domain-containing protein [Flavobacteriales bacterium]HHZ97908.1 LysM peptidoglycan-binding domain-containing protein [Flavobacteriales bacterium]HIB78499.1 LysM peptidoglycan-binding domain-containing protein [Flavobacteriales bacterium]HIN40881.1 LysM peptidoglycan-binding domain-containing protein [Flavobacteriales bacterium]HIO16335.1 LysM peptidoglycan-binding domain-containing protein [Flavobacteriales bacterium]
MSLFHSSSIRNLVLILNCTAFCAINGFASGNGNVTAEDYIDKWKSEAVNQMEIYKIPASITLAQGILESGNGVSDLALKSNNHFGIKCHADWEGGRTYHDDDEKGECFRVYDHPRDSYEDHSKFLLRNRYSALFDLDLEDYKGWAKGLKKCGYATNPQYADKLITLIERHNLNVLDSDGNAALAHVGRRETQANPSSQTDVREQQVLADRLGSDSEVRAARQSSGNRSGERRIRTTEHGVQFTFAHIGDTQKSLGNELDMMPWQFRRYNNIKKNHEFRVGDKIYLQPKKNYAAYEWHTVNNGETLWDISQKYGIKISALIRKNNIKYDTPLKPGMKLSMLWPLNKNGELPWFAKMLSSKER